MNLTFYNTLTHKKEEFKPIDEKLVKMYSCGPTVYSYAHIGNFRTYIFMDTLRRVLKYNGYKLKHVMNITDVGHLESDADEGEDKMEKAARKENKNPYEIANYYMNIFLEDMEKLHIDRPEIITKATDNIPQMIEYVKDIIKNGYAYETSKGIYFDISKLDKYPVLSNRELDDQIAGARVEVDPEKRNPYDFALWIKAPENHIMKWESPWGLSYPGWHLECSAMGRRFLGEEFDIHTGGIDHIPTHHENEIAQAKGATGKIPAKVWMHCEYLQVDGGKMSKSLGNTYTVSYLQEKGIHPLAFKLFCFTAHYRNKLNFTFDGAYGAQKALERLYDSYIKHLNGNEVVEDSKINEYKEKFMDYINDDMNMTGAMSVVWEVARNEKKSKKLAELLLDFDKVLGLDIKNSPKYLNEFSKNKNISLEDIPDEIKKLIEERNDARLNKDWAKSDELRKVIASKGYSIKDTKEGIIVTKNI